MRKLCSFVCVALLAGSFVGPLSAPAQASTDAAAASSRLRSISTCDRAYFHFFNRLNNPAFAKSRRLTDEEIGWALDYEASQRKGEVCPPMPKQVIEGILAEANSNPDSTLAGQRALAQIEQRKTNPAPAQRTAQTPQDNPPPPAKSEPTFAEQTAEWLRQKNQEQEYNRGKQYRCYVSQGRQICGYY